MTRQAQRGDHVPIQAASNIICVGVSTMSFDTDDLDDQSPTGNTMTFQSYMKTTKSRQISMIAGECLRTTLSH